jgi:hypothetical protein
VGAEVFKRLKQPVGAARNRRAAKSLGKVRRVCKDWEQQARLQVSGMTLSPGRLQRPLWLQRPLQRQHDFGQWSHIADLTLIGEGETQKDSDAFAAPLLHMRKLVTLLIDGCALDDTCMQRLGQLSALTRLEAHSVCAAPMRVPGAGGLTALTELRLSAMRLHPDTLLEFGRISTLKVLVMEGVWEDDEDEAAWEAAAQRHRLTGIPGFAGLATLRWRAEHWFDAAAFVAGMTNLTSLDLYHCEVEAASVDAWRMPSLQRFRGGFDDSGDHIGPVDLRHLTALTQLSLTDTRIDDTTVASLVHLKQLTDVDMRWNAVTEACSASLKQMTQLKRLDLSCHEFAAPGTAWYDGLRAALPGARIIYRRDPKWGIGGWAAAASEADSGSDPGSGSEYTDEDWVL